MKGGPATGLPVFATRSALLVALAVLLLGGCAPPGGSARECVYDRPLVFSAASIRAMEAEDRRTLLTHNRQAESICQAR